jgi:hypothetical protein
MATSPLAPSKNRSVVSHLGPPRPDARDLSEPPSRDDPEPQAVAGEYAFADLIIKIVYLISNMIADPLYPFCNGGVAADFPVSPSRFIDLIIDLFHFFTKLIGSR